MGEGQELLTWVQYTRKTGQAGTEGQGKKPLSTRYCSRTLRQQDESLTQARGGF